MVRLSFAPLNLGCQGFDGVVQEVPYIPALFADNLSDGVVTQTLLQAKQDDLLLKRWKYRQAREHQLFPLIRARVHAYPALTITILLLHVGLVKTPLPFFCTDDVNGLIVSDSEEPVTHFIRWRFNRRDPPCEFDQRVLHRILCQREVVQKTRGVAQQRGLESTDH
jgi:hypothetical protein